MMSLSHRLSVPKKQRKFYSGKKRKHTLKTQVIFNPKLKQIVSRQVESGRKKDLTIARKYVKEMVIDYLSGEKAQLGVVNVNGNKGKDIPKDILEKGLDQLYQDIADEVLVKIAEINGLVVKDEEVE